MKEKMLIEPVMTTMNVTNDTRGTIMPEVADAEAGNYLNPQGVRKGRYSLCTPCASFAPFAVKINP